VGRRASVRADININLEGADVSKRDIERLTKEIKQLDSTLDDASKRANRTEIALKDITGKAAQDNVDRLRGEFKKLNREIDETQDKAAGGITPGVDVGQRLDIAGKTTTAGRTVADISGIQGLGAVTAVTEVVDDVGNAVLSMGSSATLALPAIAAIGIGVTLFTKELSEGFAEAKKETDKFLRTLDKVNVEGLNVWTNALEITSDELAKLEQDQILYAQRLDEQGDAIKSQIDIAKEAQFLGRGDTGLKELRTEIDTWNYCLIVTSYVLLPSMILSWRWIPRHKHAEH
jgi:hypothetical protein